MWGGVWIGFWVIFFSHFFLTECQDEEEDPLQCKEHFVVDADAVGGHGTGSSVFSAFQSTATQEEPEDTSRTEDRISPVKKVEEDGRDSTLQAAGSASQDSVVLDSQLDSALVCGQPSNSSSDMKAVSLLAVVGLKQEPTGQSGSPEHCESHHLDGTEKEAKKKKSTNRSGMCAEKAPSGIPGAPCRQDEGGPATCRSSRCAAAQQSYKVSSVLESRSSHDATKEEKKGEKGKKALLENPYILPPVKKKSRTFYNAEQLEELEKVFHEDHYPDNEKRREIAAVIGVTPQRILVWFQNRRAKWRKAEKLNAKGNRKHPTSSPLSDDYGAPPLPVPPLPDVARDQSAALGGNAAAGNCSSLLRAQPAPLSSASASSVAGMVASCEAVQAKVSLQLSLNSSSVESFPSLPSPPPIRRATNLAFSPHSPVVSVGLDTPSSECCLSSQENGSREAFAYSIQNQGLSPPPSCHYPEQLETAGNLETMYCQYSSQGGVYQLSQYSQQHQLSQFCQLPDHLATNLLSSDHLPPPTPPEAHPAFLALPGNTGAVTYGATQGYGQNHMGGQLVPQQSSGNSADITAYQAVPWSDFYMQGAQFSNQLHSQMPFFSTAEGQNFTEPYLLQVPNGAALGSTSEAGKQKGATPDQSSNQSHQTEPELASLTERERM
ncbi:homeobox protein NOBOX isoform X1 [Neopelma chrysocephalum]|uniref:homeobox protein NOBOX isoform X1 n=1 Tax=Neopelma chrysocephalum TaxID=114329 RepID=UPI000FCD22B6|nr:homeobox protein NOBOX isoform X1 [Neopelma chrysocephalum]